MTDIVTLIDLQQDHLENLKTLIEAEKGALENQDAELLLSLANQKAQLLRSLQDNDTRLSNHQEADKLNEDTELRSRVEQAKQLLAQCQELNSANSHLIELNIASINRLSQALQASRNTNSMTYDDKGKTSSISSLGNDLKA